ncbi:MAG TPA: TonB-dependent receptor [Gemmatimonadaceae bacterium]|nr:TonB-dependent receptor [Gemmatimonadaceae bacterium]
MFPFLALVLVIDVRGDVRNAISDQPVAGVIVTTVGGRDTTRTDATGRFRLDVSGAARLRFTRDGFRPVELVASAGDTTIRVRLTPTPRTLEASAIIAVRGSDAAPVSRATLDESELDRRYFGQELPLLLTASPSITAYSDAGSFSGYSYMRLRGIDQSRINITLDGIPLNDPEDHFVYFSNFPDLTNSLRSVELQRGVGASSNGVASYAGSLTLESVSLAAARRGGDVQLERGSFDSNRGAVEYSTGLMPSRLSFYGRLSAQQTDGYRRHSGNRSESFFASGGYFGDRDIVKVVAFGGRARNGLAYLAASAEDIAADPRTNPLSQGERDDFFQDFASVQYTRLLSADADVGLTAYGMWSDGDYDVRVDPDLWNFGLTSGTGGAIATARARFGRFQLLGGAHANGYRRAHFAAIKPDLDALLYDNTGYKNEASAFAKASYDVGRLSLHGDVQVRRAAFRYEPDANAGIETQRIDWTFVNPKIGATWQANRALRIYASYGRNGREPTRNDMLAGFDNLDTSNAEFVGTLHRVRPESVRDLETGVVTRLGRLGVQANVYAMDFHHEISPIGPLSYLGLPLRKNVDRSYRRGVEVDLAYQVSSALTATANATVSQNRIDTYTDDATGTGYHDVDPLLTPRAMGNASLIYALGGALKASLDGRFVGKSYLANTGDARFTTPGRATVDGSVAWSIDRYSVGVRATNLTNTRFYSGGYTDGTTSYYYVLPTCSWFVTLRARL